MVRKVYVGLLLASTIILAFAGTTDAAVKKGVKRVVLGTAQLNGDQAVLGATYTLGKASPINVTLKSVEYTVEPVRLGNDVVIVNEAEKLMVLHYTLHNPNKSDFGLAWNTLNIFAVDSKDTNWRYCQCVAMEDTGETCNMRLKPGQKTAVYAVIKVPAGGALPKLVMESRDRLVLRYDLNGKVKPLPAPIADPADSTGATALAEVPAQMGTYYPFNVLHAKLDSVALSSDAIKGRAPAKGSRYFVIIASIKNNTPGNFGFRWNTLSLKLFDQDGAEIKGNSEVLFPSRDETINQNIEPGKELRARYYFQVPSNCSLKSLVIRQSGGRKYAYDVSGAQ